jgi:RNA polymerase sigma-70 factor, ECF subfamily
VSTQPGRPLKRQITVGNLADLEAVYRAEYSNLVRSLTLLAGSRDLPADAVQDAFVVAGTKWREISMIDQPVAWIRTVAARKLLDGHRRSSRWRALAPGISRDALAANVVLEADQHTDLLAAVSNLPHQQRSAIVLYYLNDWSVDDVASALRIAPGTVKSSLFDARSRLRATLFEEP